MEASIDELQALFENPTLSENSLCSLLERSKPWGLNYVQFSNNLHIYPEVKNHRKLMGMDPCRDHYKDGLIKFKPVRDVTTWFDDLRQFMERPVLFRSNKNPLFHCVARPMYMAWESYKVGNFAGALYWCDDIEDQAWSLACRRWIERGMK